MTENIIDHRVPATLEDVAKRAGVSTATVSRCLNSPHQVTAETRSKVEEALQKLRYTPHFGGRALASNRTNTIGIIIPTMENAIFALGLQAMEEELSANGIALLVASSHYDDEREAAMIKALIGRGVDGLALIGLERPESTYDLLKDRGVPLVVLWSNAPDSSHICVGFDNRAAAAKMARRVLALGHRRIAMIAGLTAGNDRAAARVDGVRAEMQQAGLRLEPPLLVQAAYSLDAGTAAAAALLSLPERPTAIICGNDVLAAGALRAVRQAGLRTPEDVSVVGFDDIDLAVAVHPALTTVRVPHRRMGRAAARLLMQMSSRGSEKPKSVLIDTTITERDSLAPPV